MSGSRVRERDTKGVQDKGICNTGNTSIQKQADKGLVHHTAATFVSFAYPSTDGRKLQHLWTADLAQRTIHSLLRKRKLRSRRIVNFFQAKRKNLSPDSLSRRRLAGIIATSPTTGNTMATLCTFPSSRGHPSNRRQVVSCPASSTASQMAQHISHI